MTERAGRRALIIGAAGQDGSYLTELLLDQGYQVLGVVRPGTLARGVENLAHRREAGLQLVEADLLDTTTVAGWLDTYGPDELYNFAGVTFGPDGWSDPARTAALSTVAVAGLLEAARTQVPDVRFFQASSSWIFGRPTEEPQDEATPIAPVEPYGAAKAYAQHLIACFRERYGLHLSSGIFYNHESPRRAPHFVSRKITATAARIAQGADETLVLGDLEARRDWGYAQDYVKGAWLAARADEPRDYVFATGRLHTVAELAERAFARVGLDWLDHVRTDGALHRTSEVAQLRGDARLAESTLGWRAETSFEALVDLMVDADRATSTDH